MKVQCYKFMPLHIEPTIAFFGSDEEIEKADNLERKAMEQLKSIITDKRFYALEYKTKYQRRILHHSTRPGITFQLSYMDSNDIPVMHESYIKTNEPMLNNEAVEPMEELLKHFVAQFRTDKSLTIKVLAR